MAGGKLISTGVEFPDATTQTTSGLPLTGGALTGAVTTTSTFDGRDVAADGVTADAALPKAGGTMTGTIAGFTSTGIDDNATSTAITIDASENVGIGTTSPNAKLSTGGTVGSKLLIYDGGLTTAGGNGIFSGIGQDIPGANITSILGRHTSGALVFGQYTNADDLTTVTEHMRIDSAGDVTVKTGNLVIGTSGKGIDFSATSDGSGTMTSEVLDDYEEGTWTPALKFGGANVGMTGTFTGEYVKVGGLVTVSGQLTLTAKGSSTGIVVVTGLPFVAGITAVVSFTNYKLSYNSMVWGQLFSSQFSMYEATTAGVRTSIDDTNFSADTSLSFSASYHI